MSLRSVPWGFLCGLLLGSLGTAAFCRREPEPSAVVLRAVIAQQAQRAREFAKAARAECGLRMVSVVIDERMRLTCKPNPPPANCGRDRRGE